MTKKRKKQQNRKNSKKITSPTKNKIAEVNASKSQQIQVKEKSRSLLSRIKIFFSTLNKGVSIFITLITLITSYFFFIEKCKSEKEIFDDKTKTTVKRIIPGIPIPSYLNGQNFSFRFGKDSNQVGITYPFRVLLKGVEIKPNLLVYGKKSEPPFKLRAKISDGMLKFSIEFKDILSEQIIGYADFESFHLVNNNTLDYKTDDRSIEVYDMEKNIVFSARLDNNNVVIKGYSILSDYIIVANQGLYGIPKNFPWSKDSALSKIEEIKSILK